MARGGGEVATVIANLTVGPDSCGGWAIYVRWGKPATKKLHTTVGGKAPRKEFLTPGKLKKTQKYQSGIVALHEISQFQKSTEPPHLETSLLMFSP